MQNIPTRRITLEKEAQESLTKMLAELKKEERFIKISPSKLVSWIVFCFGQKYFLKQKDRIIKAHFSSKAYLKNVAQTVDDSPNLSAVLKETLNRIALKGKKHD